MTYSKKSVEIIFMQKNFNIIVSTAIDGIARIKLNESKTYNALSYKTIQSLINIFKNLNNDTKTKVIIIEGLGKGFSAGHNLKEIRSMKKKAEYNKLFKLWEEGAPVSALNHYPKYNMAVFGNMRGRVLLLNL